MIDVHSSVMERQKGGEAAHKLCHIRCIPSLGMNCFTEHLPCHMPFATLHRLSGSFQAPGQRSLYKTLDTTARSNRTGGTCCPMTFAGLKQCVSCRHKTVLTSMSLPIPPEGEVSRERSPTSGKAPCTCLATRLMLSPKLQQQTCFGTANGLEIG